MAPSALAAEPRNELTIVPAVGGTSDIGFGGGYLMSLARVVEGYEPYVFRVENAGSITFKSGHGDFEVPYANDYVVIEFPHVIKGRFGVRFVADFSREQNLTYYGLGNASEIPAGTNPIAERYEYGWTHPRLDFQGRYHASEQVLLTWGLWASYNWMTIRPGSVLYDDMYHGSPEVRRYLHPSERHGVATTFYGVGFDSRDHEVSAHSGQYHILRVELSPGGWDGFPYRFARVNLALRGYVPLERRVTLAVRIIADGLFGDPPFYELSHYDDTYAIGGVKGVRGVPAERYYGKAKLFGNLELRTELFRFHAFSKDNVLGLTGFFDAGRLWLDYKKNPAFDGHGLGLKYGIGGGPRWHAGDSFVLRADAAWSPDAHPVGLYLVAGQLF